MSGNRNLNSEINSWTQLLQSLQADRAEIMRIRNAVHSRTWGGYSRYRGDNFRRSAERLALVSEEITAYLAEIDRSILLISAWIHQNSGI